MRIRERISSRAVEPPSGGNETSGSIQDKEELGWRRLEVGVKYQ